MVQKHDKPIIFTVDWEAWFMGVYPNSLWDSYIKNLHEPTLYLLELLAKNKITAIFYVVGWLKDEEPDLFNEIVKRRHLIGNHGYWHKREETNKSRLFRSPFWHSTPMPWPPSGGFFFRAMPYHYVKWAVKKSGVFWIHPHELDENHARLKNPVLNFKRHVGLKTARKKLERLCKEVKFDNPKAYFESGI